MSHQNIWLWGHQGLNWRRQWHPTPVLLPGKSHGQRSLVGCSLWVSKSQTQLSDFTFTFVHWRRKWQPTPVFLPGESRDGGAWWAAVSGVAQSWTWLTRLSSSSSSSRAWIWESQRALGNKNFTLSETEAVIWKDPESDPLAYLEEPQRQAGENWDILWGYSQWQHPSLGTYSIMRTQVLARAFLESFLYPICSGSLPTHQRANTSPRDTGCTARCPRTQPCPSEQPHQLNLAQQKGPCSLHMGHT